MEHIQKGKLLPQNQAVLDRVKAEYEANVATDDERRKVMIASSKDPQEAAAFAAAREVRVYLNWLAHNNSLPLFEYMALEDNELPVLISETDQSYNVLEINQHGMAPVDNWVNLDTVNSFLMYQIESERIDYPVMSIQTGALGLSDRVNLRLAYAIDRTITKDIWTLITAAYGSYPAGTYSLDGDITASTIPTTNEISSTSEGALTLEIFKTAAEQADLLGLKIQKMIINPTERSDLYDWESLLGTVSDAKAQKAITNDMREKILRDADIGRLFGHDFEIILDNTRPKEYAEFFCGPAGILFDKPSMGEVEFYSQKELRAIAKKKYHEGLIERRVIKPLIPAPNRLNFFRIKFV